MKFAKFVLSGVAAAGIAFAALASAPSFAEKTVTVGGAPMFPSKNIIQNAVNSKDHTTLVAAVKAAGLVDTLQGKGPFTVFAPVNDAFAKLPEGTVDTLLKPENKNQLTKVLTYHVVPGRLTAKDLMAAAKQGGGKATFKTVEGEELTFQLKDGEIWVWDAKGGSAKPLLADKAFGAPNGVLADANGGVWYVTYKSGDAFATSMLRPFLTDSGLTLADIGWLLGTVGFIAGLLGRRMADGGGPASGVRREGRRLRIFDTTSRHRPAATGPRRGCRRDTPPAWR